MDDGKSFSVVLQKAKSLAISCAALCPSYFLFLMFTCRVFKASCHDQQNQKVSPLDWITLGGGVHPGILPWGGDSSLHLGKESKSGCRLNELLPDTLVFCVQGDVLWMWKHLKVWCSIRSSLKWKRLITCLLLSTGPCFCGSTLFYEYFKTTQREGFSLLTLSLLFRALCLSPVYSCHLAFCISTHFLNVYSGVWPSSEIGDTIIVQHSVLKLCRSLDTEEKM